MKIIEHGNPNKEKIILIHGFESPYQIWDDYVEYYKNDYCVIVPVLTGHNINEYTDFISLEKCAKELEEYCILKYGNEIFAIYGMSMGGVYASMLWQNKKLQIHKLIMESSPLLGYGSIMKRLLTKQYLTITHKAQARDEKTVKGAINSMITKDKLTVFLELIDHITDTTITNYIKEIGNYKLSSNVNIENTDIYYLYGGKISEILFRRAAKFLEKNYQNATIICLSGKGHCEDALINPKEHIKTLNKILKNYK